MPRQLVNRWSSLVILNLVCWGVLGFYSTTAAAPRQTNAPFANAEQQRFEIINQLRAINAQLKEQNALLRSGGQRVNAVDGRTR